MELKGEYKLFNMKTIKILGAIYGKEDVTSDGATQVMYRKHGDSLMIIPNNKAFSCADGWKGKTKTFVVIYQYGNQTPRMAITEEKKQLLISYKSGRAQPTYPKDCVTIVGAALGLQSLL